MSSPTPVTDQPRPLPIQIPLHPGESPDSFIRRLAAANHLRPSYLRTYLNYEPAQIGSVQAWRLAAVTGRTVDELTRMMPELRPATPTRQAEPRDENPDEATTLPAAVRREAGRDPVVKRLSRQFAVPRRTIVTALTGRISTTRFRQRQPRTSPILDTVASYIDQLIAEDPEATIWSIWKKVLGEPDVNVCYGTIRNYVNRARAHPDNTRSVKHLVTREELFRMIRAEGASYDLVTTLADRFSTGPATIKQALAGQTPLPPNSQKTQRNLMLEPLRAHIDQMIAANPCVTITNIWEQLVDHHHAEVSYATVRDYITRERRHSRPRGTVPIR
jgi:hypothetical protein